MKNLQIFLFLLSLLAQPLLGSEKSSVFTVDMGKLFRSSDFGRKIISTNNIHNPINITTKPKTTFSFFSAIFSENN